MATNARLQADEDFDGSSDDTPRVDASGVCGDKGSVPIIPSTLPDLVATACQDPKASAPVKPEPVTAKEATEKLEEAVKKIPPPKLKGAAKRKTKKPEKFLPAPPHGGTSVTFNIAGNMSVSGEKNPLATAMGIADQSDDEKSDITPLRKRVRAPHPLMNMCKYCGLRYQAHKFYSDQDGRPKMTCPIEGVDY